MYLPDSLSEIKNYRPACLRTGKEWFVEYYAWNPEIQLLARKKIKLNHIEKITDRRTYANGLIRRLNTELERGWNPFIASENASSYTPFDRVLSDFIKLQRKKFASGELRPGTLSSYESMARKLQEFLTEKQLTSIYVYQFNRELILHYLDHLYNTRNKSSRTRDNHLKFIRLFSGYMVERGFMKNPPTDGVTVLGKSMRKSKNRQVIPEKTIKILGAWLQKNNPGFFLASEILYFCMIRPREMTFIRISHIDLDKSVIFVPGETAKNYKDAVVTIPAALNATLRAMRIGEYPEDFYLFSKGFVPGPDRIREQLFGKYWDRHVRKALDLPMTMKFYSLKDTGITDMIRAYNDPLLARDQARHHDLSITNIYTPSDMMQANERIRNDERRF